MIQNNNSVEIAGEVVSGPVFDHETFGERFYKFFISAERLSGYKDIIPVIVSERLFNIDNITIGKKFRVFGQFRSFNDHSDGGNHMILFVFAQEINEAEDDDKEHINSIWLDGYICKKSEYRKTPKGREISDFVLAVNRQYGKSDYIPCIVWGRNAKYFSDLPVGKRIWLSGRIQSRVYNKKISDDEVVEKTAYEISVSKIELVEEE